MKCRYCGYNLTFEDEFCPHCGKENDQAKGHVAKMKYLQKEYEETKEKVIEKDNKKSRRKARLIVIAIMILIVVIMRIITGTYSDFDIRYRRINQKKENYVRKHEDEIRQNLERMEEARDYIALKEYMYNYNLRSNQAFNDYSRVFTGAISYCAIRSEITCLVDGFKGYDESTGRDRCNTIAIYMSDWEQMVEGGFWDDPADSPMHAGEHGAFLEDIRKDTRDMVQVYFDLSDDEARLIWKLGKEAMSDKLYDKCMDLYPEVCGDE